MSHKLLDIKLQMEVLISEREGMIAGNQHRLACGLSLAYTEAAFLVNAQDLKALIGELRN